MPLLTEAVGFLASSVSFLVLLPQGVRVWADRDDPPALVGVSLPTQALLLTSTLVWALYAALAGAFWVGAPVVVNAPVTLMTIVVVLRSRQVAAGGAGSVMPVPAVVATDEPALVPLAALEPVAV